MTRPRGKHLPAGQSPAHRIRESTSSPTTGAPASLFPFATSIAIGIAVRGRERKRVHVAPTICTRLRSAGSHTVERSHRCDATRRTAPCRSVHSARRIHPSRPPSLLASRLAVPRLKSFLRPPPSLTLPSMPPCLQPERRAAFTRRRTRRESRRPRSPIVATRVCCLSTTSAAHSDVSTDAALSN